MVFEDYKVFLERYDEVTVTSSRKYVTLAALLAYLSETLPACFSQSKLLGTVLSNGALLRLQSVKFAELRAYEDTSS